MRIFRKQYFQYYNSQKKIMQNLYMLALARSLAKDAVEICHLTLYLKLIIQNVSTTWVSFGGLIIVFVTFIMFMVQENLLKDNTQQ